MKEMKHSYKLTLRVLLFAIVSHGIVNGWRFMGHISMSSINNPTSSTHGRSRPNTAWISLPPEFLQSPTVKVTKTTSSQDYDIPRTTSSSSLPKKQQTFASSLKTTVSGPETQRLRKLIISFANSNSISQALDVLRYQTQDLSKEDVNYLATKTMHLLASRTDPYICLEVLSIVDAVAGVNVITLTSAMSVFINDNKFDQALNIFDDMKTRKLEPDVISYMNAARAMGTTRSWSDLLNLLDEAHKSLGDEVHDVVVSAMTNFKFSKILESLKNGETIPSFASSSSSSPSTSSSSSSTPTSSITQPTPTGPLHRSQYLLSWLIDRKVPIKSRVMDALCSVACAHGTVADIEHTLEQMVHHRIPPSQGTFNILLNRCAADENVQGALYILQVMRSNLLSPDEITYNTLLKLFVSKGDADAVNETLHSMETFGISHSDYTKSALLHLYAQQNDTQAAVNLVSDVILSKDHHSNSSLLNSSWTSTDVHSLSLTPYLFANAINACGDWQVALQLLQRAVRLHKADAAVYTATAQVCASQSQYAAAFRTIDIMLSRKVKFNKYSLSVIITSCISAHSDGHTFGTFRALDYLEKYLNIAAASTPSLLDAHVCQRVVRELTSIGASLLACSLHLGPLKRGTCKSETLTNLFNDMQQISNACKGSSNNDDDNNDNNDDVELETDAEADVAIVDGGGRHDSVDSPIKKSPSISCTSIALQALALLGLYTTSTTSLPPSNPASQNQLSSTHPSIPPSLSPSLPPSTPPSLPPSQPKQSLTSHSHRHLLRTCHFNSVLSMLSYAGMYSHAQRVFMLMAGRDHPPSTSTSTSTSIPPSTSTSTSTWKWKPGTFTIAQLVRAAREANLPLLAKDAIEWGVSENTFIPQGVIRDAISFVYGQGRTDLATEIYQRLYGAGAINHWVLPALAQMSTTTTTTTTTRPSKTIPPPTSSSSSSPSSSSSSITSSTTSITSTYRIPQILDASTPLIIDLHGFSRGMSFAAINTAINEIRERSKNQQQQQQQQQLHKEKQPKQQVFLQQNFRLEIITGRGLGREAFTGGGSLITTTAAATTTTTTTTTAAAATTTSTTTPMIMEKDGTYIITEEVQRSLIEDFYPPIPSSTVPGNPGRLIVNIQC